MIDWQYISYLEFYLISTEWGAEPDGVAAPTAPFKWRVGPTGKIVNQSFPEVGECCWIPH